MDTIFSGTMRRAIITLAGVALVALNKKFSLSLSETELLAIAGMVGTYLAQSAFKESSAIKAEAQATAAAAIKTPVDVVDELRRAAVDR